MARLAGTLFAPRHSGADLTQMLGGDQPQIHHEPGVCAAGVGPQLLWCVASKGWVVGDGWLGNSEQLTAQLHSLGYPPASSLAELLMQAYRHWGIGFPTHLQGSFALALYDRAASELILVGRR
jgi:asparagine synthetase B (glutamine-hydrolysing)